MQKSMHLGTAWKNRSQDYKEKSRKNASQAGLISNFGRGQTNREFSSQNENFQLKCMEAGVKPTKRQASKFRRGLGKAAQI